MIRRVFLCALALAPLACTPHAAHNPDSGSHMPTKKIFTSKDGTQIACFVSGSGPALVLVHGTSADHTRWAPVLPAFEAHHTVYACDRRGRGGSGDSTEKYSIEREFEDVAAIVAGIDGPVDLVGHSYGGICSLEASTRVKNLRRLVLYEPPIPTGLPIYPPGIFEKLQAKLDAGDRDGVVADFLGGVARIPPDTLDKMRRMPAWQGRIAAAHTLVREIRDSSDYAFKPEKFRDMKTPTLLLLGGSSPGFFKAAIEKIHDTLPTSKIVVMDGQQHAAIDSAPDLFTRDVLSFLDEPTAAR